MLGRWMLSSLSRLSNVLERSAKHSMVGVSHEAASDSPSKRPRSASERCSQQVAFVRRRCLLVQDREGFHPNQTAGKVVKVSLW